MRKILTLTVFAAALPACFPAPTQATISNSPTTSPTGSPNPSSSPSPSTGGTTVGGISGAITRDTTWSGATAVSDDVTVNAGVTLTVSPGATVTVAEGKVINVLGTLNAQGSTGQAVTFAAGGQSWGGIAAGSGGSINLAYATLDKAATAIACPAGVTGCALDHTSITNYSGMAATIGAPATLSYVKVESGGGGGITVDPGSSGAVSITDSTFHNTGGDAITISSGVVSVQHNAVYGAVANGVVSSGVTIHCALHINNSPTLDAEFNDLYDTSYGMMMAGSLSSGSKVTSNNFFDNQISTDASFLAGTDLSNDYWGGTTPPVANGAAVASNKISGTGPR